MGKIYGTIAVRFYLNFLLLRSNVPETQALEELGLRRYCCRRMLLTHVDLVVKLLNYNRQDKRDDIEVES